MAFRDILLSEAGLSRRSWYALQRVNVKTIGDLMNVTEEELWNVRNLGSKSVQEIVDKIVEFKQMELEGVEQINTEPEPPANKDKILQYVRANDVSISNMGLSVRPQRILGQQGFENMSDIIFLGQIDLMQIPSMGDKSAKEITEKIQYYMQKHEKRMEAFVNGDESALWSDSIIRNEILSLYQDDCFTGFTFDEMNEQMQLPEPVTEERIRNVLDELVAGKVLRRIGCCFFRDYGILLDDLASCDAISDRNRVIIRRRLDGEVMEDIGQDYDLTRERVRQIINKGIKSVRKWHLQKTGTELFEEDFFRYLYETYAFDAEDASEWFGIPPYVWRYFELCDVTQGENPLGDALDDAKVGADLRQKIDEYLKRDVVLIGDHWVAKKRADLEKAAVELLCKEDVSFDVFAVKYNELLEHEGIPYDKRLYYTEDIRRTRKNRLAEARFLLWKLFEQMRYYDIDSRDYTELLDALDLDSYINTEVSTLKFLEAYPDIMVKYDIRDQYELHNLLKKIVPEGSYHDMNFTRMPIIRFGTFDREAAIRELIIEKAPVTPQEVADLLHDKYGYDIKTIFGSYLPMFRESLGDDGKYRCF